MEFTLKATFNASAKELYSAWLNSEAHTAMTGGEAITSDKVGEEFSAWDGYIQGKNLELVPHSRIKQSWRTSQFDSADEDSILELIFSEKEGTTEITLIHSRLAEDGGHYIKGWDNHYFQPMKAYFT